MAALGDGFAVRRLRPALALVTAAWLLGLAVAAAPHLVHHLFEADDHEECPYLAAADHDTAAIVVVAVVPIAPLRRERAEPAPSGRALRVAAGLVPARGPPPAPLALA